MTETIVLFVATSVIYTVATALHLALLFRSSAQGARIGRALLVVAAIGHTALLVTTTSSVGALFTDMHSVLGLTSLLGVIAYVLTSIRYRVSVLGAFITPVTLLFFLGAGLAQRIAEVSPAVRSTLLPWHVAVNVLGLAALTLAFGAASAYLVQDSLLRRKKLGGLFQRLPPLDVLDSLGLRLVVVGFVLLTVGVVTGAFFAVRLHHAQGPSFTPAQSLGLLAWTFFAGVLGLRVAVGWRGRRAAFGTVMGYLCATAVLVGYFFRASGSAI